MKTINKASTMDPEYCITSDLSVNQEQGQIG